MALSCFNECVGGVRQLRVGDGTSLGAHVVTTLGANAIGNLATIGARVFFSPNDGTHGQELRTSDGTAVAICSRSDARAKNSSRATGFEAGDFRALDLREGPVNRGESVVKLPGG